MSNLSIGINNKSDSLAHLDQTPQQATQARTGNTISFGDGEIGVRQQREIQAELLGKFLMRRFALSRNTKNGRTSSLDRRILITQATSLLCAARCVVHRVKIHHQFLPPKISQTKRAAIGRYGRKIRSRITGFELGTHQK